MEILNLECCALKNIIIREINQTLLKLRNIKFDQFEK